MSRQSPPVPRSEHFSLSEFGVDVPQKYWSRIQILMDQLEVLRESLGGAAIRIISGFRSRAHNRRVGGAWFSQHKRGKASDLRVAGYSPKEVADEIEKLIREGRMLQGGLGRYENFTHYDIRGRRSRWDKT